MRQFVSDKKKQAKVFAYKMVVLLVLALLAVPANREVVKEFLLGIFETANAEATKVNHKTKNVEFVADQSF